MTSELQRRAQDSPTIFELLSGCDDCKQSPDELTPDQRIENQHLNNQNNLLPNQGRFQETEICLQYLQRCETFLLEIQQLVGETPELEVLEIVKDHLQKFFGEPLVNEQAQVDFDPNGDTVTELVTTPKSKRPTIKTQLIESANQAYFNAQTLLRRAELGQKESLKELTSCLAERFFAPLFKFRPKFLTSRLAEAIEQQTRFDQAEIVDAGGMGWIYKVRAESKDFALKIAQLSSAPELGALYEREISFLKTIAENELDPRGLFTPLVEEGAVHTLSRHFRYIVMPYYSGPERPELGRHVMTLKEAMPVIQAAPRIVAAHFAVSMFEALVELQRLGFIHGDLKPSNYFLPVSIAAALLQWRDSGRLDSDLLDLVEVLRRPGPCVITADFGGVREMQAFLLGDEIRDEVTGDTVIVRTPAYANYTGLLKNGSKAHSDRYAIACILIEMVSGESPHDHRSQKIFKLPPNAKGNNAELGQVALEILNDPMENSAHTDSDTEVEKSEFYLGQVRSIIDKDWRAIRPGLFSVLKRHTTKLFKRFPG